MMQFVARCLEKTRMRMQEPTGCKPQVGFNIAWDTLPAFFNMLTCPHLCKVINEHQAKRMP